jgi:hypothetical protein
MLLAPPPDLCMARDFNTTEIPWLDIERAKCESEETRDTQRLHSKITAVVLAILFVSLLGVGMGQTAVYTLGIPYIDDNVASRESPLYFGKNFYFHMMSHFKWLKIIICVNLSTSTGSV